MSDAFIFYNSSKHILLDMMATRLRLNSPMQGRYSLRVGLRAPSPDGTMFKQRPCTAEEKCGHQKGEPGVNNKRLTLSCSGLNEQYITILHNVFFALCHNLALCLDRRFVSFFPQGFVVVSHRLNEGLLKISVDDARGLRRFRSCANRPLPHFVCAGREKN